MLQNLIEKADRFSITQRNHCGSEKFITKISE